MTTPAIQLGAVLWNRDADSLRRRAAELEALGFRALNVGDHLGHFPPLTACAIIAQATSVARVGPLVLNNDFRHPVVVAQEAAALADLSSGRFELGIGAGYNRREYDQAGISFDPAHTRAARLAESAHILRHLLAGETVDYDGVHYQVQGASLRGATPPVPVLIGGNSQALHKIAAEHADILNLPGESPTRGGAAADMTAFTCGALDEQVTRLRELAGDRHEAIELHVLVQWHEVTSDRTTAAERAASTLEIPPEHVLDSPYALIGTAEEIAEQLHDHHDRFGISRWVVFADRPDLQPADTLGPVLGRTAPPTDPVDGPSRG